MSEAIETYATREEAIGVAMREAGPDGIVVVHEAHCASVDGEDGCTCEPVVMRAQAGTA